MNQSAQYLKVVYWSDEDQCFVGMAPGLMHGGCHGDDERSVYEELLQIVDEVIESHRKHGDPLPPPTVGRVERVIENTSLAAE
jgi:predicted RNase H-like HicB family nuclease